MQTPGKPVAPVDPAAGSQDTANMKATPQRTSTVPPPGPGADAGSRFTILPSLQRIASGPVCENGVCYVPGAAPADGKPGKQGAGAAPADDDPA